MDMLILVIYETIDTAYLSEIPDDLKAMKTAG